MNSGDASLMDSLLSTNVRDLQILKTVVKNSLPPLLDK